MVCVPCTAGPFVRLVLQEATATTCPHTTALLFTLRRPVCTCVWLAAPCARRPGRRPD